MKLIFKIALKFLFGKKSKGIINVISTISITGVAVGAIALLTILSVFNGLHGLMGDLYGTFDPDIKITAVEGKSFSLDSINIEAIRGIEGVNYISEILEENAHLKYGKRQSTGTIMGVDSNFNKVSLIDSIIVDGMFTLKDEQTYGGIVGFALADQLNLRVSFLTSLVISAPKRNKKINLMNPYDSFNSQYILPKGVFLVKQIDYDSKYSIIDINLARDLFQYKNSEVTSLYIDINDNHDTNLAKKDIKTLVGKNYTVLNRHEQHASFYKMMRVEKIVAYLILCFILIIATFNLIGTISMLIFDKKEGIQILKSIGATKSFVTRIFLLEGWLISIVGVFFGLAIGILIVKAQEYFGLIRFSGSNFIVDAYPVKLEPEDIFYTFITVVTIGFLATWYPVKIIINRYFNEKA